ncbi:hypothetical protein [Rubinisphaera margarita]|uniref:hypothetical protein n=1 Tax=Rubinisphaera margarita TaxID=2909586 RepID=UPI001EE7C2C2|nr:hypothetical protein [Rubinisphaera margarita]MCG6158040.1 hypothetical protein [Rubinisphaera margarita]
MRAGICVCLLGIGLLLPGCGGGSVSDQELPAGSNAPSPTENVRVWLEGVAESGQLDSGISMMHEEAEKMKANGVANADEIATGLKELETASGSSAIKSKANALLQKVPNE